MNLKKLLVSGIAVAAICASIPYHVSAAEGTMTLTANVPAVYELSIPITNVPLDYTQQKHSIGKLAVKGNIEAQQTVTLSVKEINKFTSSTSPAQIPFEVIKDDAAFTQEVWTADELKAGDKEIELHIQFAQDAWKMAHSGDYSGTIVFSAELN